ncbi:MAG TPA: DUF29 domain-containing protein [Azospirillum sp.]
MGISIDEDVYGWSQEQASLLRDAARTGRHAGLDFETLAEQIEDMGRTQKQGVRYALTRVVEHLLYLQYVNRREGRVVWKETVLLGRYHARDILDDNPPLRDTFDLEEIYRRGRTLAELHFQHAGLDSRVLPEECPYDLAHLLDEGWWPKNKFGWA